MTYAHVASTVSFTFRVNADAESFSMPCSLVVSVACTLTDQLALHRVTECILQQGGRAFPLSQADVLDAAAVGTIGALVYDLEPGDASAVGFVRRIRAVRPDWPIWLY